MINKIPANLIFAFFIAIVFSCSPAKQLNRQVVERNKRPVDEQVKVVYPSKQLETPGNIKLVYDYENIFTTAQGAKLDSLVRLFEKSNLISIKISTLPGSMATVDNFNAKNSSLLKEWDGVHGSGGKCISILISKELNKVSIHCGVFAKKLLSDAEIGSIIETKFNPAFSNGRYFDGTWDGAMALMDTIRKNINF
jgi:uncharacterized membrane protein YgcG